MPSSRAEHIKNTLPHENSPLLSRLYPRHRNLLNPETSERSKLHHPTHQRRHDLLLKRISSLSGDHDRIEQKSDTDGTLHWETVIHLVKGYIGCGILSLPWALTQLGIPLGIFSIAILSLWTSYNCWAVVKLKRYVEEIDAQKDDSTSCEDCDNLSEFEDSANDEDEISSSRLRTSVSSNLTYPDVGEWAYGTAFQKYVAFCICAQQLAICTVFVGFVGENLFATLKFLGMHTLGRQWTTILCAPIFCGLGCAFPSLESMTLLMMVGTLLMIAGFSSIAWIGILVWDERPIDPPSFHFDPTNTAMAICGILYSFEGICIILPVESAIRVKREFSSAFGWSMTIVTMLLCGMASLGVVTFGKVTNGSLTAFLLDEYQDNPKITLWLMLSNSLVSLSILLSYPLQLFPAAELVAKSVLGSERVERHKHPQGIICDVSFETHEPMREIPEHRVPSMGSFKETNQDDDVDTFDDFTSQRNELGADSEKANSNTNIGSRDAPASPSRELTSNERQWRPGDSPTLRAGLVVGTVLVAVLVPKVESLISLVGAVTGSSTALLIPPILELAYLRHLEERNKAEECGSQFMVSPSRFFWKRLMSLISLLMGFIFALIGSYFSVQDIIKTYG